MSDSVEIIAKGISWAEAFMELKKRVKKLTSSDVVEIVQIEGDKDTYYCHAGEFLYKIDMQTVGVDLPFVPSKKWARVRIY